MKLSKLFSVAILAVSALSMSAQGIEFMPENARLQDALDKAKQENKMVFLDCYTSWCGPCKMMSTKIFPTQEVGDFMNPKFVSIKIDMEKGEGPEIASRLQRLPDVCNLQQRRLGGSPFCWWRRCSGVHQTRQR